MVYMCLESMVLYYIYVAGKIIVTTLAPISTIGLTKDDLASLMQQTYDAMRAQFLVTSDEVRTDLLNQKLALKTLATPQRIVSDTVVNGTSATALK